MVSVTVQFLTGRFHATPWDHHVNEGVAEWPISPWRILRALTASLHTRCPGLDRAIAEVVLRKLAVAPTFTLPRGATGHTRHYLSLNGLRRTEASLTFDAFVALDRDARVYVHWPVDLTAAEWSALDTMSRGVSYLGRAESWCEVETLKDGVPRPESNCWPRAGDLGTDGVQVVRVLCPAETLTQQDLERTTADLQREGWNDPPGTRWVWYDRPARALSVDQPASPSASPRPRPVVAEFALGGRVLPLLTDAVLIAERIRAAVLSRHGLPSETLSGKTPEGDPLKAQHRHAHYVPDCRPRGNRVTHVLVYAPEGLSESEQAALATVTFLPQPHNRPNLDIVLSGFGDAADLSRTTPLFAVASRWRSRTPFVLVRHPRRGKDTPTEQVGRELQQRGFPQPLTIVPTMGVPLFDPHAGRSGETRWVEFVTSRRALNHPPGAFGFEITFRQPVQGPLLLGYGCHYGLGQFEAVA